MLDLGTEQFLALVTYNKYLENLIWCLHLDQYTSRERGFFSFMACAPPLCHRMQNSFSSSLWNPLESGDCRYSLGKTQHRLQSEL